MTNLIIQCKNGSLLSPSSKKWIKDNKVNRERWQSKGYKIKTCTGSPSKKPVKKQTGRKTPVKQTGMGLRAKIRKTNEIRNEAVDIVRNLDRANLVKFLSKIKVEIDENVSEDDSGRLKVEEPNPNDIADYSLCAGESRPKCHNYCSKREKKYKCLDYVNDPDFVKYRYHVV
jgi:hypothetical protein